MQLLQHAQLYDEVEQASFAWGLFIEFRNGVRLGLEAYLSVSRQKLSKEVEVFL